MPNNQHVVMLTPQWLNTVGGPTTYVKNLRVELEKLGWRVDILTKEVGSGAYTYNNFLFLRHAHIFAWLQRLKPDVVHIHGSLNMIIPAIMYKLFTNKKVRVVFTFHTQPRLTDYFNPSKKVRPTYWGVIGFIGTQLLSRCDVVTSVSKSIIDNINAGTRMRIPVAAKVIPSGAVAGPMPGAYCSGFVKMRPILTTIGVMSWDWKVVGHGIAIEAISLLRKTVPGIILQIAGDGVYRAQLESRVRMLGVSENVVFLGNRSDVADILAKTDIYVHMALNEGCSLAIIEAMMAGKPAIVSSCGGNIEIMENEVNGLVVAPDSVELANAVQRLLSSPNEAAALASRAAKDSRDKFSWPRVAGLFANAYNN